MGGAGAVVVCLGPHELGRWQKHEIQIVTQRRIEAGATVIPLVFPTCGESDPPIPLWLSTAQTIDLRRDEADSDPFGRLLKCFDARDPTGHYRPSVLILRNKDEANCDEACQRIVSECGNALHRVRVIDYSETLLNKRLAEELRHTDVLVSLLAPDSYDPLPGGQFADGVAAGAKRLADDVGIPVIQWRSDKMDVPNENGLAAKFRTTETETYLPALLAKLVSERADARFTWRKAEAAVQKTAVSKRRAVLGYPLNGKRFVRQVAEDMELREIECDSPPKWDLVLSMLQHDPPLYEAIVVVLTGDDDWLCDCTVALRKLQDTHAHELPPIRAFLHKADDKFDADPIPVRLDQFEEYFGVRDLPRLAQKIASTGGHQP